MKIILSISFVLAVLCACSGCVKVQPWEKENLAKPHMAFDTDPLESKFRNHVFQSKEGSFGGSGVGGGGCGCS